MLTTPYDEIAHQAEGRRRRSRHRLLLLNITVGWGLGQIFFTLVALAISPRLQAVLANAPFQGPLASTGALALVLVEPVYFWGGTIASLLGAGIGWGMGRFQAKILEEAGALVRDAKLERTVAARTVDLTLHNQSISQLNLRLEEARRELEERNRELRTTQERLVRSERLAAMTETAVSVNHEINGPLMVILGNSEILLDRLPEAGPEELRRRVCLVKEQTLHIAAITRKLAHLVEPATTSYLDDEGIRMVDLERSTVRGEETPVEPAELASGVPSP